LKSERNTLLLEQFTAFTDHNPLLDILTNIEFNPLINSFYDTLSEFIPNMAICHIKGILNVLPDMLSRGIDSEFYIQVLTSGEDPLQDLIDKAHFMTGHQSIEKTYLKMRELMGEGEKFEIPVKEVKLKLKSTIENCQTCNRTAKRIIYRYNQRHYEAKFTFDTVNVDLFAFKRKDQSYQRFLILTDTFSRYSFIRMIKDKSAEEVAKCLIGIFYEHGFPTKIQSDRGKEFNNVLLDKINELYGVQGILTAAYSPNQFIERYVQNAKHLIQVLNEDFEKFTEESIEEYLKLLQIIMNNRTIVTLGTTPFLLFYGRRYNSPSPTILDPISELEVPSLEQLSQRWMEIHQELFPAIRERVTQIQDRREQEDIRRFPGLRIDHQVELLPGTIVFTNKGDIKIKKLMTPTHAGPFTVVRRKENLQYELKPLFGSDKTFVTPLQNIKVMDGSLLKFNKTSQKTVQSKRYNQYSFNNQELWIEENDDFTSDPEIEDEDF
jgi:hypothetical protein